MKDKDLLVDRVSKKTNVKKEDIFKLANDLQKKDLNNEKDMRDFIQTVAKVTNQSLDQRKIDKLIKIMQNKDVLNDVEKMISRLKNICMRGGFETVFVNMYYYDILHTDYAKYYLEAGFKIVTAGHQLDIYFLSRLKSIIELSDYTVSNSVGTHLGYCIWMNKPHYIIDDQIINETNERDYKKIGSFFLTYTEQIQPEQYAVVAKYWGFDSVRTSEELKSILK